jgi:hypothetical protein
MTPPPRTRRQRKQDTLDRLERDTDAWVATADAGGTPYMVPLSFLWDGDSLLVATPASSPTSRNLQATGKVRLGIGPTRDLVLIEGTVDALAAATEIPDEVGDAFAAKTGFDPRQLTSPYRYFRIRPQRLQAWREVNELKGRELMRGGHWVVPD